MARISIEVDDGDGYIIPEKDACDVLRGCIRGLKQLGPFAGAVASIRVQFDEAMDHSWRTPKISAVLVDPTGAERKLHIEKRLSGVGPQRIPEIAEVINRNLNPGLRYSIRGLLQDCEARLRRQMTKLREMLPETESDSD